MVLYANVEDELHARVKIFGIQNKVTISEIIKKSVEEYLNRQESKKAGKQ